MSLNPNTSGELGNEVSVDRGVADRAGDFSTSLNPTTSGELGNDESTDLGDAAKQPQEISF